MSSITVMHHAIRRGMEEAHRHIPQQMATIQELKPPAWGVVLVALTALVWVIVASLAQYTYSRLIPALVMVESTQAILYEPLGKNEPDDTLDSKVEQELFLVKQEPITSSCRGTLKHLRSVGGFRARTRGFQVFAVTIVASVWVNKMIDYVLPFVPLGTTQIITAVLLANLHMTWTHIVMSSPSEKTWFRRVPSFQAWKKIAGPTLIYSFAQQISALLPLYLITFWIGVENISRDGTYNLSKPERDNVALKSITVIFVSLAMVLMVYLPAKVAMTRVQASLLAEDQEPIVPFDRTFDGKASEHDGVIGFIDAWKTFPRSSRIRLIKTYLKSFFIQVALAMFFFFILAAELVMIIGSSKIMQLGREATDPNVSEIHILPIDN